MQKRTGEYIIERFDQYGHKKKSKLANSYILALRKAYRWTSKDEGNSAVILRILFNSIEKGAKL